MKKEKEKENIDKSFDAKNNNNFKLELLTPLDKKDDERVLKYLKHINEAIERKEVKNLALTGVYGSGKSTIIESYKSKYPDKEFLNISLASFKETDEYNSFKDQIQLAILQQILYSQDSKRLPNSRINRIREVNIWSVKYIFKVFTLLASLISAYFLFAFFTNQLNPNNWDTRLNFDYWCLITVFIFLVSSFFVAQSLVKSFSDSRINKVNIKGEIDVTEDIKHKDFLNKYLDEILYFFEKIPTDIVIIEDLDRFNSVEIYRTLREINFILNNYLKNTKKENYKKVMFLYAIKDDLFLNEFDRTKFFDLIIPTIPFVNYSNSKNVLTEKLKNIYKDELFNNPNNSNKDFINTVSTFITDNRILVNIINEFVIYKEQQKLQKEEFNPEKLLALIIYKNLRPRDFSRLHKSNSNIDIIFSNKNELILKSIKKLADLISSLNKEIEIIKTENLEGLAQLNTIFLYYFKDEIRNTSLKSIIIASEKKTPNEIINNSIDLNPLYGDNIKYTDQNNYTYNSNITLEKIDNLVGYKYSEKYDTLINGDKLIEENENEINEIMDAIKELQNESLSEILKKKDLSKDKIKEEFSPFYLNNELINENERAYNDLLLIFLLENGYIDEHYRDYISTFQKGELTENDHEFKINIISRINDPKSFEYKLTNISDIIEGLPIRYFNENRILNFDLLDYLIVNKESYLDKFKTILKVISKWNDKRVKQFFTLYIKNSTQKGLFILELSKYWKDLWNKIESETTYLEKEKELLLFLTINNLDNETLILQNNKKALSNYISNNISMFYKHTYLVNPAKIKEIFSDEILNIKFKELLPVVDEYKEKFEFIYRNNHYEINLDNIAIILDRYYKDSKVSGSGGNFPDNFLSNNYQTILNSGCTNLLEYINSDLNDYIENTYLKIEDDNIEEEKILTEHFLNNKEIDDKLKLKIIDKVKTVFDKLIDIKDLALKKKLIELNKVFPNWFNVYSYVIDLEKTYIDKTLINFYNNEENSFELSHEYLESENTEIDKVYMSMRFSILECDELTNNSYENLLNSINKVYGNLDFEKISEQKVSLLLKNSKLSLTTKNYDRLRDYFPNKHIDLLEKQPSTFIENISSYTLDDEDKTLFIESDKISKDNKIKFFKSLSKDIIYAEEFSKALCKFLAQENYNESIDYDVLKSIIENSRVAEHKVKLFILQSHNLSSNEERIELLELMGSPYSNIVKKGMRPKILNNKTNLSLVKLLYSRRIISSYKESDNFIRVNTFKK